MLLDHDGPAVLSGYDNDLYNDPLSDWERVSVKPPTVEKVAVRTEILWVKR